MSTDPSISWVDIELDSPLSDSNHQEFIEALNESALKMAELPLPGAAGIRIILPETPGDEVIDRLSFICAGMRQQGIAVSVFVREEESLHEVTIPESALFNRLAKQFNEKFNRS